MIYTRHIGFEYKFSSIPQVVWRCGFVRSGELFFSRVWGDGPAPALFSGLPPDHSKLGLITKTSIPVWSWSHSVRTLMRNMWSCPDTQSEETQSLSPSFSPPSSSLPPLSHYFFRTLSCFTLYISFCRRVWSFLTIKACFQLLASSLCFPSDTQFYKSQKDSFLSLLRLKETGFSCFIFSIVPEQVTHCQQKEIYVATLFTWYTLV